MNARKHQAETTDDDKQLDPAMFETVVRIRFGRPFSAYDREWWRRLIYQPHGATPQSLAEQLAAAGAQPREMVWESHELGGKATLRIHRPQEMEETYLVDGCDLTVGGRAMELDSCSYVSHRQRSGRLFGMLPSLIEAAESSGSSRILAATAGIGRYALLKAGFLPDFESNIQIIKNSIFELVRREKSFGQSELAEIVRRISWAGPSTARIIASIATPTTCRELAESGHRAPFGRWLYIEACDDWDGYLQLDDSRSMAVAREAAASHYAVAADQTSEFAESPYSERWGDLAGNPALSIGASGQAWREAVQWAWTEAGGTTSSFDDIFPHEPGPAPPRSGMR